MTWVVRRLYLLIQMPGIVWVPGFKTVREMCKNSGVPEGLSIKGSVERDGILFVMEGEKAKEAGGEGENGCEVTASFSG